MSKAIDWTTVQIWEDEPGVYKVMSRTHPGIAHTVRYTPHGVEHYCPARHGTCWHLEGVRMFRAGTFRPGQAVCASCGCPACWVMSPRPLCRRCHEQVCTALLADATRLPEAAPRVVVDPADEDVFAGMPVRPRTVSAPPPYEGHRADVLHVDHGSPDWFATLAAFEADFA